MAALWHPGTERSATGGRGWRYRLRYLCVACGLMAEGLYAGMLPAGHVEQPLDLLRDRDALSLFAAPVLAMRPGMAIAWFRPDERDPTAGYGADWRRGSDINPEAAQPPPRFRPLPPARTTYEERFPDRTGWPAAVPPETSYPGWR